MDHPPAQDIAPGIPPALKARFAIETATGISRTRCSYVHKVVRADGSVAALKRITAYGHEEIVGTALLDWYGPDAAVRILDREGDAVLLEWLDGEPLSALVHRGEDEAATAILCDLVENLHTRRPAPPPEGLPTLQSRFDPLFAVDRQTLPPSRRAAFERAREVAHALIDTQPAPVPLHGDLHHDNVMASDRGWRVIDPKGLWGDPAYEVANIFRNPDGVPDLARHPGRIGRLADAFSRRLRLDRNRVLGWAMAHCAISMCWAGVLTDPEQEDFFILDALDAAHRASQPPG